MSMFPNEPPSEHFFKNIGNFPLLSKYLRPSLAKRLESEHWYENRVIRYVLRGAPWVNELERTFVEANLDRIQNSNEIFGNLNGAEDDYDQQLFDAITEVRLARWARSEGYYNIEKLQRQKDGRTPEFRMERQGETALSEAKHFRARDYPLDFVADRLEGLALKTALFSKFGLTVETSLEYGRKRDTLLDGRRDWRDRARNVLTESFFLSLERCLAINVDAQVKILDGLSVINRSPNAGEIRPNLRSSLDPEKTAKLFLEKLECELMGKITQIRDFTDTSKIGATHAIVFFSGTDPWEIEWSVLWEMLGERGKDLKWVWERVHSIHQTASALISIPFELIVGKGNPVKYGPFPWKPEDF